jgi:serine/threonine protein kinase
MANPMPDKPTSPHRSDSKGSGETRSAAAQSTTPGKKSSGKSSHPQSKNVSTSSGRLPGMEAPRIPGYEILAQIGRGNMGVIYKARQAKLNRIIALKTILAGKFADEVQLRRFTTEAEAVARLQHPNIVQVFNFGEHEGQPFLVMEYIDGGSLDQKLKGRAMQPRKAAQLILVLARAIHVAHQQGIIHRDLKPGNILLTAKGSPKITDFGLAKRLDAEVSQTSTGAILGTPSYMSPEQARGGKVPISPMTDVYGLGAMLYEFLTGRPPFREETYFDTIFKVVSANPVPPKEINPNIPRALDEICLKCLQKDPTDRYMTAQALADALEAFLRMPEDPSGEMPVANLEVVDETEPIVDLAGGGPGSASSGRVAATPAPPAAEMTPVLVVLGLLAVVFLGGATGLMIYRTYDFNFFPLMSIPAGFLLLALTRQAWLGAVGILMVVTSLAFYLTGQTTYPIWPPLLAGALVAGAGWSMSVILQREQPAATLGAFVGCGVGAGLFLLVIRERFFSVSNWMGSDMVFILMFIMMTVLLTLLGAACGSFLGRPVADLRR